MPKIGVLLINLGTPDDPSVKAVGKYLKEFLMDFRVIDKPAWLRHILVKGLIVPFRSRASAKLYKQLWTEEGSPLKHYGYKLAEGVQNQLGEDFHIELAMRYQSPSIKSAIDKLIKAQVDELVVFPLFPQYASSSTGSAHEEVMRVLSKQLIIPPVRMVNSYPTDPRMIKIYADNGRKLNLDDYDHVLFSFHGLPERHLRDADITQSHCQRVENCCSISCEANKLCYSNQCHRTAHAIAEDLGLKKDQYSISYQSRLGRDPWVKPYTDKVLEERHKVHGDKKILVFCPAFVSDCLETTIEISVEYQEEFEEFGGDHVQLVPSLNDNPEWIKTVAEMVKENSVLAV